MQVKHYQSLIRRNANAIAELEAEAIICRDNARFEKQFASEIDTGYVSYMYGRAATAKRSIAKLVELQNALKDEMKWKLFVERAERDYEEFAFAEGIGAD